MATIKEMLLSNTDKVLEATELLKVLGYREGQFVWKQLTAEGGDFVAFVTADDEGSYPNKGTQDGYYYVKFDPLTAIAENIREGVSIFDIIGTMSEGIKGAYGFVTVTRSPSTIKVAHNLNVIPSYCGIHRFNEYDPIYKEDASSYMNINGTSVYDNGSGRTYFVSNNITKTATDIAFESDGYPYASGTYFWYAILS